MPIIAGTNNNSAGARFKTHQLGEKRRLIREANPRLLVFAGVPGSGKSTLVRRLIERHPDEIIHIVRSSTRPMRPEETNETRARFMDDDDYSHYLGEGSMYWSEHIFGHNYGYHVKDILDALSSGKIIVLESAPTCILMENEYHWTGMQDTGVWSDAKKYLIFVAPARIEEIENPAAWPNIKLRIRDRLRNRDSNIDLEELLERSSKRMLEELGFWSHQNNFVVENDGSRSIDHIFEEIDRYVIRHVLPT